MNDAPSDILYGLSNSQVSLIWRVADFLRVPTAESVSADSDLVGPAFAEDFRNRLALYHALNEEPLKKKTFEFAFAGACRAAGKTAIVNTNSTHAGRDVEVDGTAFSCKTEASQGIKPLAITISKLMEARWIRDCTTSTEYRRNVMDRVVGHLAEYDRILMLRAFKLDDDRFAYHLVEIPKQVLLLVSTLQDSDFSRRTRNNSTSADVMVNGRRAFRLRLDGSVEKVTVSDLDTALCRKHASWMVSVGSAENLG